MDRQLDRYLDRLADLSAAPRRRHRTGVAPGFTTWPTRLGSGPPRRRRGPR